jgi:hypothetical protein
VAEEAPRPLAHSVSARESKVRYSGSSSSTCCERRSLLSMPPLFSSPPHVGRGWKAAACGCPTYN